jgi:hypothetical protein
MRSLTSYYSRQYARRTSIRYDFILLFIMHLIIMIIFSLFHWRYTLSLTYILYDFGASFHAAQLLHEGLIPNVDFGYNYGILNLALMEWYHDLFGWSLRMHAIFMYICMYCCLFVVYATLIRINLNRGATLIILTCSVYYFSTLYTPVHSLEALIISIIIYYCYSLNYVMALLCSAICFFVKPALCVYFGVFSGVMVCLDCYQRKTWKPLIACSISLLCMAILLSVISIIIFGWTSFSKSLFPRNALASYHFYDYGFHQFVGLFRANDYSSLITQVLCGRPLFLLLAGVALLKTVLQWWRQRQRPISVLILNGICFAVIYIAFLFTMYGNADTWLLYAYVLSWVIGLNGDEATIRSQGNGCEGKRTNILFIVTLFMVLMSLQSHVRLLCTRFYESEPVNLQGNTIYLTTDQERNMHREMASLNADSTRQVAFLGWGGCVTELYSNIVTPKSWVIIQGVNGPVEERRIIQLLDNCDIAVVDLTILSILRIPQYQVRLQQLLRYYGNDIAIYNQNK